MRGTSLFLFGPGSAFRHRCLWVVTWRWFDGIILAFIAASSVTLALDAPGLADTSPRLAQVGP